jgi:hypothetical protein
MHPPVTYRIVSVDDLPIFYASSFAQIAFSGQDYCLSDFRKEPILSLEV